MNCTEMELSAEMNLANWLAYWLEMYIRPVVKPSTYESYRDHCEKHIIPTLGNTRLCDITPKQLQLFFNAQARNGNRRTGGPLSPKSLRNMRVVLDVALKQALSEDLMVSNPVPLTVIKSVKTRRVEVMTDDMQERIEQFLFENGHPYHAAIQMSLYTGIRRGEVCALRWRDYDEKTGRMTIRETVRRLTDYDAQPGDPKTKLVFNAVKTDSSHRSLVMPEIVQKLIRKQKETFASEHHIPREEDFIFFSSSGGIIDPDNLQHYFAKILKQLGLEHVKFHAIRHTFATRAIENGIDVSTVSGILGHADVTTTTHFYVHPRDKAMARAMRSITPIYQQPDMAGETGDSRLAG